MKNQPIIVYLSFLNSSTHELHDNPKWNFQGLFDKYVTKERANWVTFPLQRLNTQKHICLVRMSVLPLDNKLKLTQGCFMATLCRRAIHMDSWNNVAAPDSSDERSHRCPYSITSSEVLHCIICGVCVLNQQFWCLMRSFWCPALLHQPYSSFYTYLWIS